MKQPAKIISPRKQMLGHKLRTFRQKLALSIGRKKITQNEFGEMYAGVSGRVVASYELGDSEMPADFLFSIWERGHSIDNLFSEGQISDIESGIAKKLYSETSTAMLDRMTQDEHARVLKEMIGNAKTAHHRPDQDPTEPTFGQGKKGPGKTRTIKKR